MKAEIDQDAFGPDQTHHCDGIASLPSHVFEEEYDAVDADIKIAGCGKWLSPTALSPAELGDLFLVP